MKIDDVLDIYEIALKATAHTKSPGVIEFFDVSSINQLIKRLPEEYKSEFTIIKSNEPILTLPCDDVIKLCRIIIIYSPRHLF